MLYEIDYCGGKILVNETAAVLIGKRDGKTQDRACTVCAGRKARKRPSEEAKGRNGKGRPSTEG